MRGQFDDEKFSVHVLKQWEFLIEIVGDMIYVVLKSVSE
jgi:hypothetical protein